MKIKNISRVMSSEEIVEILVNRGRKFRDPCQKIQAVGDKAVSILERIYQEFSEIYRLNDFYKELLQTFFDLKRIKRAIGYVRWGVGKLRRLRREYLRRCLKNKKKSKEIRREFYGRLFSIIRDMEEELEFLEEVRKVLKDFPVIKDLPTVVLFGFPNVGKSSLLKAITGSSPEIAEYPFTTKNLMIGYRKIFGKKVQFIDVPGVLDRKKKNQIERRALVALKYLPDLVVYVFDPSETCGYTLDEQKNLYKQVKELGKRMIVVANKCDLDWKEFKIEEDYIKVSAREGVGVEDLVRRIGEMLDEAGLL